MGTSTSERLEKARLERARSARSTRSTQPSAAGAGRQGALSRPSSAATGVVAVGGSRIKDPSSRYGSSTKRTRSTTTAAGTTGTSHGRTKQAPGQAPAAAVGLGITGTAIASPPQRQHTATTATVTRPRPSTAVSSSSASVGHPRRHRQPVPSNVDLSIDWQSHASSTSNHTHQQPDPDPDSPTDEAAALATFTTSDPDPAYITSRYGGRRQHQDSRTRQRSDAPMASHDMEDMEAGADLGTSDHDPFEGTARRYNAADQSTQSSIAPEVDESISSVATAESYDQDQGEIFHNHKSGSHVENARQQTRPSKDLEMSAVAIQRWFRRQRSDHAANNQAAEDLKSLLAFKRLELETVRQAETETDLQQRAKATASRRPRRQHSRPKTASSSSSSSLGTRQRGRPGDTRDVGAASEETVRSTKHKEQLESDGDSSQGGTDAILNTFHTRPRRQRTDPAPDNVPTGATSESPRSSGRLAQPSNRQPGACANPLPQPDDFLNVDKFARLKAAAAARRTASGTRPHSASEAAAKPAVKPAAPDTVQGSVMNTEEQRHDRQVYSHATNGSVADAVARVVATVPTAKVATEEPGKVNKVADFLSFLADVEKDHTDAESEFAVVQKAKQPPDAAAKQAGTAAVARGRRKKNQSEAILRDLTDMDTATQAATAAALRNGQHRNQKQPSDLGYLEEAAATVSSKIASQRRELAEKTAALEGAKQQLREQRDVLQSEAFLQAEETHRAYRQLKSDFEKLQKESEADSHRHLTFIDQLIKEKTALGERCEAVVSQLKTLDKKSATKIKALQERHAIDMKKQKELILTAERQRREKWVQQQTKSIKEMTVKGLQPELERMVANHKRELDRLQEEHEYRLRKAGGDQTEQHLREIEALEQDFERRQQAAVEEEREACRARYRKQLEAEQHDFYEQRRRLLAELQEERDRYLKAVADERAKMEEEFKSVRSTDVRTLNALREEHDTELAALKKQHDSQLRDLRAQVAIEKESWEEMFMRKQQAAMLAKEEKIREEARQDRDKEIEMVIQRLEEESSAAQEENERQLETRVGRMQDKFSAQLKDAERAEQTALGKYNESRQRLSEVLEELASVRGTLTHKERELADVQGVASRLGKERDNLAEVIKVEFQDQLAGQERDIELLRKELSQERANHRAQLAEVQATKDQELDNVHARVKQTISKKDETIKTLREQFQAAALRADHLEHLLEKQHRDVNG